MTMMTGLIDWLEIYWRMPLNQDDHDGFQFYAAKNSLTKVGHLTLAVI